MTTPIEILHEAGVPAGVFNLVNGDGPTVGEAMSSHPGIDMMSFTGSTRAGIAVAKGAEETSGWNYSTCFVKSNKNSYRTF